MQIKKVKYKSKEK